MKYYLKRPQSGTNRLGKRKTFAVVESSKGKFKTVNSKTIEAINQRYLSGLLSPAAAEKHLYKVISELERKAGIFKAPDTFHNDNQKILDQYWNEEYGHRNLEDPDAARGKLNQALRALGQVSLLSGSQQEIQAAVNKFKGNKQRMIVGKLNALLEFIKRKHEVRLKKDRAPRTKVRYLSEPELEKVLKLIDEPELCLLCRVLFLTGMRLGEAFAVDPGRIKPNRKTVYVDTQLTRDEEEKSPKWGSERSVFIVPPGAELLEEWGAKRANIKESRDVLRKKFKSACKRAFPNQPDKVCSFKELRHSYAILLLNKGVSLSLIAQSLGNSLAVCQRHYAGFELSPDSVEAIDAILSKPVSK